MKTKMLLAFVLFGLVLLATAAGTFLRPFDTATFWIQEDFVGGQKDSGFMGQLGWQVRSIVGAGTNSMQGTLWPHPGSFRMTTSSTSGQGNMVYLVGAFLVDLTTQTNWEALWIFRLVSSTTNVRFRVGIVDTTSAVAEPNNGIWLRYDTNAAYSDSAFHVVCRASSVNTEPGGTPTYTVDTNWHRLRIASSTVGTIDVTLDTNATVSIASGCPTASLAPGAMIVTDTTAAKDVDLDYFAFRATGLAR